MNGNCNVIRDLLPLYVDNLTSQESNEWIENHVEQCIDCKAHLNAMKQEILVANQRSTPVSDTDVKLIKRIKNRLITVLITTVVIFTLLGLFLGAFGNVLFQEGNPIPLASSIIKLESTNEAYVEYAPAQFISEAESSVDRYHVVSDYLSERGWTFIEQMGSGLIYEKDEQQMVVETRQYSRYYYIWRLPVEETLQE